MNDGAQKGGAQKGGAHPDDGAWWTFVAKGHAPVEMDALAEHLEECDACLAVVSGFQTVLATMESVHQAPAQIAQVRGRRRLENALRSEARVGRTRRRRLPYLAGMVAAFAGAAVATVATGGLSNFRAPSFWAPSPDAANVERDAESFSEPRLDSEPRLVSESVAGQEGTDAVSEPGVLVKQVSVAALVPAPRSKRSELVTEGRQRLMTQRQRSVVVDDVVVDDVVVDDVVVNDVVVDDVVVDDVVVDDVVVDDVVVDDVVVDDIAADDVVVDDIVADEVVAEVKVHVSGLPVAEIFKPAASLQARTEMDTRPRVARADGTPTSKEAYDRARALMAAQPTAGAGWVSVGDLAALAGDVDGAVHAYLAALPGPKAASAAARLETLVRQGVVKPAAAIAEVRAVNGAAQSGEGLRLVCLWGLQYRGDRAAVSVCQSFGRQFPQHPNARSVALSAGRTAEFKLQDLSVAEEEYSRAILVSQYAGVAGTSALFARARCRMKMKSLDEARADLRLFLHVQPEARWRTDVKVLAGQLDLPLP